MLQTLLVINLSIFVPLILFVEFFRSVDEYFKSTTRKEAFIKGYLPYLFLFLAINSIIPFAVFPNSLTLFFRSLSSGLQILLFVILFLTAIVSVVGLIASLPVNKWRARYGTYITHAKS